MANPSRDGVQALADLTTSSPTNKQKVARVAALIPDPDNNAATAKGFLDEMSPGAATQLLVELAALEASITNV